ncbi:MAG: hypothetical protein ACI31R_00735 [Bacilli bacterium]
MARPLKESKIKKMDLTVKLFNGESKKLGKQIGFNRYVVDDETKEIATLSQKLEKEGDALLLLEDNGKDKPVIKIVENLFQTADKPYAYVLDENGKVKFLDENVKIYDISEDEESSQEVQNAIDEAEAGATVNADLNASTVSNIEVSDNKTLNVNINGSEESETTAIAQNGLVANGGNINATLTTDVDASTESFIAQNGANLVIEGDE